MYSYAEAVDLPLRRIEKHFPRLYNWKSIKKNPGKFRAIGKKYGYTTEEMDVMIKNIDNAVSRVELAKRFGKQNEILGQLFEQGIKELQDANMPMTRKELDGLRQHVRGVAQAVRSEE